MINKIKSLSKRTIALLLSLLMLLSSGIVGAVAANVELAETGADLKGGTVLYLKPNSNWTSNGARFAIYLCNGSSDATWVSMTQVNDSNAIVYTATVPSGQSHKNVIFCRMNGGNSTNDWNNRWNQTNDLTYDGTKNCYTVANGAWSKGDGSWSTYTPITYHTVTVDGNALATGGAIKVDGSSVTPTSWQDFSVQVPDGKELDLTLSSPTNYYISALTIDGYNCINDANYFDKDTNGDTVWWTFKYKANVSKDFTIKIEHSENPKLTVNYDSSMGSVTVKKANGSTVTTGGIVDYKKNLSYTITPKDGYVIKEVKINDEIVSNNTTGTIYVTSNPKLDVTFARDAFDVKFIVDGNQYGETHSITYGGKATTPVTEPTKTGYNFLGWSLTDGGTVVTVEDQTINGDTTFYAVWEGKTYKISYVNDDNSPLGTGSAKYDTNVNEFAGAPSNPTKISTVDKDFKFKTWVYENGNPVGANDKITGDLTLKASYTESARNYKVNFSTLEGGTVAVTANGASIADGGSVPYGTVLTLTATADKFYTVGSWTANGEEVSGTTYTVTGDVTLAHTFAVKPSSVITFDYDNTLGSLGMTGGEGDIETVTAQKAYRVEKDGTLKVTISIKQGVEGYYIKQIGTTSYEGQYGNSSVTNYTVTATDTDQTIAIDIAEFPSNLVNTAVSPENSGTVKGGGEVYEGSSCTLSATPAEGYTFVNWTYTPAGAINEAMVNLSDPVIQFVPQEEVTFTANFAASKGTVNVSVADAESGSVDTKGGDITYPETLTATATANTSKGYLFTHWTVKAQCKDGSEAKEGTDYAIVRENDNVIEIRILTNGTVVDVVANFANAQSIKVYTYSDGGFQSLKITESNGTETLIPFNGSQDPITFGDKTWYTPGDVTLTAGYNDEITAQMFGSDPTSAGTGTLIMFDNSITKWSRVYLYTSQSALWGNKGGKTAGAKRYNMVNVPGTDYWYTHVETTAELAYTMFVNKQCDNYNDFPGGQGYEAAYRSDAKSYYTSNKIMYVTNGSANATDRAKYYSNGSWNLKPTIDTDTDVVDITAELYNGNEWKNLDEIWLYFSEDGKSVVGTQRRVLDNYVTSANVKNTYNYGVNDDGYTTDSWSAFTSAYTAALNTLGTGSSTQAQIDAAYTALETAYKGLTLTPDVKITGSHGAMPDFKKYYGTISFPDEGVTVTKHTEGNIGDSDNDDQTKQKCEYLTATVNRNQIITINTTVKDSDLMVLGWVVNGTEFIPATQDIDNADLFVGTYTCSSNAVIVPIYFRDDTIAKFNEGSDDIIKLYAKTDDSSTTWGNYMAAYTWTASTYKQFGRWTGQLMIPDESNPGMYYTYVEKFNPEAPTEVITGITFNNYGNNTGIYTGQRYQAYDYYEFMELADQDFDNIVFELNESDNVENWPSKSKLDMVHNAYNFYPFTDFSGNEVDITRTKLTDEQKALDPALYIVRTGPCDPDTDGIGHGTADLSGSDFYVNAYVYDAEGNFIVACKTYELLNLADLKTKRGVDLTSYAGKPVEVDYASLTDTSGNKRYDGEWFGTKYGLTTVDIKVEIAYIDDKGRVVYYSDSETPNYNEAVGGAYINGKAFEAVDHGSEGHIISATVAEGNDFVGWYRASVASDGTVSIDVTATPLFAERSATIDASADAVYVAVFMKHPLDAFTVNNYYYTYDDFKGQTMSPYVPPVFGNDTTYSNRDVQIKRTYNSYTGSTVVEDLKRAGTYTQTMSGVNVGDILEITIYTKPTFPRDYVYAWYIQANDSYGVNFEEIGTNVIKDKTDVGDEKSFTFTYTVEKGVSNITVYSDVVHTTDIITLTYIYTNRFGEEMKYIVKHKLTQEELNKGYAPTEDTIKNNAPKVDDLFKDLEWKVENTSADATNWTLRATEDDYFDVLVNVDGQPFSYRQKFNTSIEIKAYELVNNLDRSKPGVWYVDKDNSTSFTNGDKLVGYGPYYGLVVTEDINLTYTSDYKLVNQIILADAVYGAEVATDENGVQTVNKVYVDYLISYLLNVFTGQYIDLNGNNKQDANEPTIYEPNNTSNPVSIEAIEKAGYKVDYGLVLELLNTFNEETKQNVINTYYGKNLTNTAKIQEMLKSGKTSWSDTGFDDTYFYKYASKDFGSIATNKNRVLMTFGYNNTDANRNRYYNAVAYLVISDKDGNNPNYLYSNQATLNIQNADKITN